MEAASKQILEGLPHYSDKDLERLLGMLTLNMYGAQVSKEVAEYAINEHDRREAVSVAAIKESRRKEALTLAEQINQNRFSGEEITSEQTVRLCELLAILLEA